MRKKATFPLATGESYTDRNGQKVDQTEWHNIVLWRRLAEIAEQYIRKGDPVYIEGKMKTRSYEKDGEKRYITEIEVQNLSMLGSRQENAGPPAGNPAPRPQQQQPQQPQQTAASKPEVKAQEPDYEDDLPF